MKKSIELSDILHPESYKKVRQEKKKVMSLVKKERRLSVGPYATFYFESYETIWHQIHEMIYIEKGGYNQAIEEISAYKSLIPNGSELIATLMFEIDDKGLRENYLRKISGIENQIHILIDQESIPAESEDEVERTRNDGKTSAVHFLHFPLSQKQVLSFKDMSKKIMISFSHESYSHSLEVDNILRNSLIGDLD